MLYISHFVKKLEKLSHFVPIIGHSLLNYHTLSCSTPIGNLPGISTSNNGYSRFKTLKISRYPNRNSCFSSTAIDHCYKTPASKSVFSDISRIDSLTPRELRTLLNDAITSKVDDVLLWSKAVSYCISHADNFKFFDILSVLDSLTKAKVYDKTLLAEFSRILTMQVPKMEPRHFVQAIHIFASTGTFPELLFLEIFYGIIRQSDKMYASEYVDIFLCLAKWDIKNQQLLSALLKSVAKNVSMLRYADIVQIMACCKILEVSDETFYFIMDSWQQKELAMMTIQELMDACKRMFSIEVKWAPYEEMLFKEFIKQTTELDSVGISQLADPFDCLDFLRRINSLSREYLLALSKWCADAVHKPPTRSQKRPLTHQLVQLYNLIWEYEVDDKYVDKAVLKFVTSKGGLQLRSPKPIPTVYKPRRRYIYTEDPKDPGKTGELAYIDEEPAEERGEESQDNDIIKELEPYPKWIDNIKIKESTQSCGKAAFRPKPIKARHKNVPVQE
ncbi:hypothetical protein BEWA_005500 [Theileria equi strain WA]|uniref:Uncharacterized protein n=1 Tax=Theileria equi strain WA TaxID=1537102 RepID=L0AZV6_THEEQ|nr:hypothetical protein BEWA_005500 [Theileria equi strain WA]AFZ81142.1 hypothetical protein BEWA_005500 [Theileria equi strain WA]|eukprot:XP_004830808.1 hypothetical protein BEWA_005500 [Theileria equi strain WA]